MTTTTPNDIRVIALHFSLPPVKLRRNHGQGKFTAAVRAEYSERMHMEALAQGWRPESALSGLLHAEVMWFQTGNGDTDNCLAGAKVVFDAMASAPKRASESMTYLGIMADDGQIKRICVERERVATKAEERVEARIERR